MARFSCLIIVLCLHVSFVKLSVATCPTWPQWIAMGEDATDISCVEAMSESLYTIPPGISSLVNLTTLDLINLPLVGTIPDLSSLIRLEKLRLKRNSFTGSLPDVSALTKLTHLVFANLPNLSMGSIPDFGSLAGLSHINLSECNRNGTMPASLAHLSALVTFWTSNNFISGTIPLSIAALPNLESVNIADNILTGTVPIKLITSTLIKLRLGKNQLSGSVSDYPFNKVPYDVLTLNSNRLYGQMSDYEATSQGLPAPGESLGDYLADGEACADNRELDCSSGESSCSALNQVCCKAVYDLSNVRGECDTGYCKGGTGECIAAPTKTPSTAPTKTPSTAPTKTPSTAPTKTPTGAPTKTPTGAPTKTSTGAPTKTPTGAPTKTPTGAPTKKPTGAPTKTPTGAPTKTRAPSSMEEGKSDDIKYGDQFAVLILGSTSGFLILLSVAFVAYKKFKAGAGSKSIGKVNRREGDSGDTYDDEARRKKQLMPFNDVSPAFDSTFSRGSTAHIDI